MQEQAQFDQFAKDYRQIHNENVRITGGSSDYFAQYKVELVHRLSRGKRIEQILDLGCGDGLSETFFSLLFPQAEVTGIDPSGESIHEAQQRNLPSCHFKQYDGKSIPMADNSVDLVFLSCIMHHVSADQHAALLAECRRVLRKGGWLYIFEHNPLNPLTRKIVRDCAFDADAVLIRAGKLKSLVKSIPFIRVNTRFTLFLPRHPLFRWMLGIENWIFPVPLGGQYLVYGCKN